MILLCVVMLLVNMSTALTEASDQPAAIRPPFRISANWYKSPLSRPGYFPYKRTPARDPTIQYSSPESLETFGKFLKLSTELLLSQQELPETDPNYVIPLDFPSEISHFTDANRDILPSSYWKSAYWNKMQGIKPNVYDTSDMLVSSHPVGKRFQSHSLSSIFPVWSPWLDAYERAELERRRKRLHSCAFLRKVGHPIGSCYRVRKEKVDQKLTKPRKQNPYEYLERNWPIHNLLGGGVG